MAYSKAKLKCNGDNTTLFDGRDMYRIYYIENKELSFFISQPEDGHCQVPKHLVVLYVVYSIHISTIK